MNLPEYLRGQWNSSKTSQRIILRTGKGRSIDHDLPVFFEVFPESCSLTDVRLARLFELADCFMRLQGELLRGRFDHLELSIIFLVSAGTG